MIMNPIRKFFDILFEYYGPQKWWPCQSGLRWEIIAGAILTQNTAWTNVEKAIENLLAANVMSVQKVLVISDDELQELIRPAGFFKQKCAYLKAMASFMLERESAFEQSADVWALRKELLAVKGVGRETADSILLYAFNKPIFVIDAYTRRVAERHLHLDGTLHYDTLQKIFMDALPPDTAIFNEYHALIVALCKESCRKSGCGEICSEIICLGKKVL
jgi:endonuclease-3 related protein